MWCVCVPDTPKRRAFRAPDLLDLIKAKRARPHIAPLKAKTLKATPPSASKKRGAAAGAHRQPSAPRRWHTHAPHAAVHADRRRVPQAQHKRWRQRHRQVS